MRHPPTLLPCYRKPSSELPGIPATFRVVVVSHSARPALPVNVKGGRQTMCLGSSIAGRTFAMEVPLELPSVSRALKRSSKDWVFCTSRIRDCHYPTTLDTHLQELGTVAANPWNLSSLQSPYHPWRHVGSPVIIGLHVYGTPHRPRLACALLLPA